MVREHINQQLELCKINFFSQTDTLERAAYRNVKTTNFTGNIRLHQPHVTSMRFRTYFLNFMKTGSRRQLQQKMH